MTSFLTTHVLDTVRGAPAASIAVVLEAREQVHEPLAPEAAWTTIATGRTNADGRISDLGPEHLRSGDYRLTFAVGEYFAAQGTEAFYPEVIVTCRIDEAQSHYHVPILLSPFAYSTYRGS